MATIATSERSQARLHAFIDESGNQPVTKRATDHFVLAAVAVHGAHLGATESLLAQIRAQTNRQPHHELRWHQLAPEHRATASTLIAERSFVTIQSVVVCKRFFGTHNQLPIEEAGYLIPFRYMLERLSWMGEKANCRVSITIERKRGLPPARIAEYENRLWSMGDETSIKWDHLDLEGCRVVPKRECEHLQLADLVAGCISCAFETGVSEHTQAHLRRLSPRLFRRYPSSELTSYGLKIHPWNGAVRAAVLAAYPWLADL